MAGSDESAPEGTCFVATFGCRVNQADSEGILATLAGRGLTPTERPADAEVVVINSCTVTHRSDADIRKLVNRVHRENPAARVVVTGCYAQRDPGALVQLRGTSAVVGTSDAHRLGEVVDRLRGVEVPDAPIVLRGELSRIAPEDLPPVDPVAVVHDRTRPFVKIQDGCDAHCTYCVIPEVRGRGRSADPDRVVASVRRIVEQGYFEVVIAGIHLGSYGQGLGDDGWGDGQALYDVVRRLLDEVPGLGRLRLSGIEPMAFPLALAELARDEPRLAPHFHLPLQAGDDRTLKRMGRPYTVERYRGILDRIRDAVPDACLGTDVIVGFPGEDDEAFARSVETCERLGLDYLHVFSYSDRPGVASTRLRDKVDPREVKARSQALNAVGRRLWSAFLDRQRGRVLPALSLEARGEAAPDAPIPPTRRALAANYAPIELDAAVPPNRPLQVRITGRHGELLRGHAV